MYQKISELEIVKNSKQGKVRDIYDLGNELLIVTTDRISAFDVVFAEEISGKGKILNQIALHFFELTRDIVPNHLISAKVQDYPAEFAEYRDYLEGRSMLVKKTRVIPFECIVRGYISGSAWAEYTKNGTVGGMMVAEELKESQKFVHPLFTPSTKAEAGHDENISYREMLNCMDERIAVFLKNKSLAVYNFAHEMLLKAGIILADTKFEFGTIGNQIYLVDEILTPDSSRFWPAESYEVGKSPASYDKQYIRDFLTQSGWNKQPPAPHLPDEVIRKTLDKYEQIRKIIIGD
ncbi:MAG TPA: phosphoribosylaminoimidazolesuccinocarboxamide synthase [Candidatus Cloacimonadota bacterium]|nr:phosphoribosylaminoimidazolesuccinocarboxamide synthase [Candidatus Cloacimonadota bacterium]HQH50714.1 phosphoribosylaminoimidazolesuccinocarboxamide synthase [Candidatus Cloacimonadota bacterium]